MVRAKPKQKRSEHKEAKSTATMASNSRMEAAKSVMGQFFPAVYRNSIAAGESTNQPVTSTTITDRYTAATVSNTAGSFSLVLQISPTSRSHLFQSLTFGPGGGGPQVLTEQVSDSHVDLALATNIARYRCAGMEVVIEPTVASANIQGEWAAYCYPGEPTLVGLNQTPLSAPQAARGFFTDAKPSARYIWFKIDDNDDNWFTPSYSAANIGDSCIRFDVVTSAATPFTVYVTTTWTMAPNQVGQYIMPGAPTIIDQSAYQRGVQVFGDAVNENIGLITDPVVAQKSHPGVLARVADAVAETVGEANLLKTALKGAWNLGKGLVGAVTSLFSSEKEAAAIVVSVLHPSLVKRLESLLVETKDTSIPLEVVNAFKIIAKYEVNRGKRGELIDITPRDDEGASSITVVPVTVAKRK